MMQRSRARPETAGLFDRLSALRHEIRRGRRQVDASSPSNGAQAKEWCVDSSKADSEASGCLRSQDTDLAWTGLEVRATL